MPIAECCLDATSTTDLSCKRRRATRHREDFAEAILTTESRTVGNAAGAVETRHAIRAAQTDDADNAEVSRANGYTARSGIFTNIVQASHLLPVREKVLKLRLIR